MDAPPASRLARWGDPALGVALFALYLPTLARGATFSDGPELVTAVVTLGVGHPTGYPLFILAGHAFCKLLALPLLAVVKIEIMNALAAAIAAVLTARTARALAGLVAAKGSSRRSGGEADPLDVHAAGLAAGLMLGIAPLVWQEVRIPEVYPTHLLLVAWAGYSWIRFEITGKVRYILGAALAMGIGLAHHVTMVYMLPAAFLYLMVRRPSFFVAWLAYSIVKVARLWRPDLAARRDFKGWWGFPAACLVGFVPLLSYGFLIWANRHTTGVPWGDVDGWENLYNHFTGRQYQSFLHNLDGAAHLVRLSRLPLVFDGQFLPEGTLLFLLGLASALRRAWRPALFHLSYLCFNCAHAVHYGVGDYATYLIPGVYSCAVFIGVGLAALLRFSRARRAEGRALFGFAALAIMLAGGAASVLAYARFHRLPPAIEARAFPVALPLAALSLLSIAAAVRARRRPGWPRAIPAAALPSLLLGAFLISLVPVAVTRAQEITRQPLVAESYGAEVAATLPPGAVLMTQGDAFLFTMWYENHVRERAMDTATVDVANIRTPWFQRYVRTHHPVACDPLSPENIADPQGFARRCGTYGERMALRAPDTWVSMGLVGNRQPHARGPSRAPVARGADPRCAEAAFHDEHAGKECRCWGYGKSLGVQEGMLEEDCIESAEELSVVPREHVEIFAQRMIEDNLPERPVFERNVFTHASRAKDNPRGWDGPSYQRPSAEIALVNRGRVNQLVWYGDLRGHDACTLDTYRPIAPRALESPRSHPPGQPRRRAYIPSPRPTLLHASYLTTKEDGDDDDATREIGANDATYLHIEWFEKFHWDARKPDKRGEPVHHGVRACVFDPEGRGIAARSVISGTQRQILLLDPGAAREAGVYRVAACTVGEISEDTVPEDAPCLWTVLEYAFTVSAR